MPGTRFIAFKVPLKKSFEWRLAPKDRFSPFDLLKKIREQKEELGMIIDLTYTTRYYGPEELPKTLCYSKILTVGHEVPDNETIFKFKCAVKEFLWENRDNDKLIGVHCTHGLNRTGYLVCRYLIDVEGMEPNVAIELFNRSRGHSIERKNYIEDLQKGPYPMIQTSVTLVQNCLCHNKAVTLLLLLLGSSLLGEERKEKENKGKWLLLYSWDVGICTSSHQVS
uniref:RNA/RNP complex-1-interacting phosphatase n=1 Tax=Terrapene triunguis TaxID=2587831 RepID=A0A674I910_9SAUR